MNTAIYKQLATRHWSKIVFIKQIYSRQYAVSNPSNPCGLTEGDDAAVAAKNIKKELKAAYPGVKFSVKSKTYTMGSSIRISWTNGPKERDLQRIAFKYQAGNFDGMTDSYTFSKKKFNYGRAMFVFTDREVSDEFIQDAIDTLAAKGRKHLVGITAADFKNGAVGTRDIDTQREVRELMHKLAS